MNTFYTFLNFALILSGCIDAAIVSHRAHCRTNTAGNQVSCKANQVSITAEVLDHGVLRGLNAHFRGLRPSFLFEDFLYHATVHGPDAIIFPIGSGLHVHRVVNPNGAVPGHQVYALYDEWIDPNNAACTITINSQGVVPYKPVNYSSFKSLDHISGELGFSLDAYDPNGITNAVAAHQGHMAAHHQAVMPPVQQHPQVVELPSDSEEAAPEGITGPVVEVAQESQEADEAAAAIVPAVVEAVKEVSKDIIPTAHVPAGPINQKDVHLIQRGSEAAKHAEASVCAHSSMMLALSLFIALVAIGSSYFA